MIGVQKWRQHNGNPDDGNYIIGHHWAIAGLIGRFANRFICPESMEHNISYPISLILSIQNSYWCILMVNYPVLL